MDEYKVIEYFRNYIQSIYPSKYRPMSDKFFSAVYRKEAARLLFTEIEAHGFRCPIDVISDFAHRMDQWSLENKNTASMYITMYDTAIDILDDFIMVSERNMNEKTTV